MALPNASVDALLGPRMTSREWGQLPEDVSGELLAGRLVEEEWPDYVHEVVVAWLVHVLMTWAEGAGAIVAGSDAKFELGEGHGRKPDVSVFFAGRRPPRHGVVTIPPDIAVEVVSPSARDQRRDRVDKRAEYAAFGVRWLWLVDPEARGVEILEHDGREGYAERVTAGGGMVDVPGCGGLTIDLDALWRKTDELED